MLVDSIPTVVDSCFNFVGDSTAANITVDWLCPGEYTINLFIHTHTDPYIPKCGVNAIECGEILPLTVNVSPTIENILPTIYLCEGESYTYCGETYTSDATAYCEIDTCLFEVQPIVFMAPQFNYLGTQFVCEGSDCFFYNGMEYCDPGFYSVENFNNQCMEYDEFEIVALQEVSLNTTASNDINCLESTSHISAFVDLQGYNGNIEIVWIDDNGNTVGNSLELTVNNGGAYTCIISFPEYDNICTKESSVYIDENTEEVSATLNYGMIDCGNPETVVQFNSNQNIINHTWEGPNGFYSTSSNPILTEGGIYQVILTAENGCQFTEGFVVEENIEEPMASFIPHEYLGCLTEMMTLQINLSSTDWTITWSTGNGNIREEFNDHIQISQPGEYTATILDPFTECEYIVSTIVENDPDMLLDFDLNTSEIYCYGANDGNITIENILGGVAPYNATVNGESMINLSQDELLPGMYEIILTDANGCEIIKNTEVIELPDIIIDIATELEVIYQSNEMIYLSIESHSDIESIVWTDQDKAVLGEGLELMINISEDTEVRVTVTDIYGCEKVQDVMVKVRLADNVYIPNIFSPNQDGFNDYFTAYAVHSPGTVEELNVYDRWGNLVFSADGASINNEEKGWDGQFNGEPLPAAVYVYQATINNGGGKVETRKGSITLIR